MSHIAQAQRYRYRQTIGVYDLGAVHRAQDTTTDSAGNVYIVDQAGYCVQKFDPNGNFLLAFGRYGSGEGQFKTPSAIAADVSDNIYVTDVTNDTIQKFDASGNYLLTLRSPGPLDFYPQSIALDEGGNIYIAGRNSVEKYSPTGSRLLSFQVPGASDPAYLSSIEGIAVDSLRNIYVSDSANGNVQKFRSDGTYMQTIGSPGYADGQFDTPGFISVDARGNLYVADRFNERIQKFDPGGNFLLKFVAYQGREPMSAKAGGGRLYVVDDAGYVEVYDLYGSYLGQAGNRPHAPGQLSTPTAVSVDNVGSVYVLDPGNKCVQKYDHRGNYLLTISNPAAGDAYPWDLRAIASDHSGHLYVLSNGWVHKFDSNGNALMTIGSYSGAANMSSPQGIAIDSADNIYITDQGDPGFQRILKFDSNGNLLTQFTIPYGSGPGQSGMLYAIDVDASGNMYVQDILNLRILKFGPQGNYLSAFGMDGTGFKYFDSAFVGLKVDALGNVYVTDGNRIQKFDPNGKFNTGFGSSGSDHGQFNGMRGMTVTANGDVYIVDGGNARVEVFAPARFDLDLDGNTDLLWQNTTTGDVSYWLMNGTQPTDYGYMAYGIGLEWKIVGAPDMFNNGRPVILWRNMNTGDVSYWLTNGTFVTTGYIAHGIPLEWKLAGTPDLNGDGKPDLLWQNTTTGDVSYWMMDGLHSVSTGFLTRGIPLQWQIAGTPDLNGDGKPDLLWENTATGDVSYWLLNGTQALSTGYITHTVPLDWQIAGTPDLNGDGKPDLLWYNRSTGDVSYWLMDGLNPIATGYTAYRISPEWRLAPVY